MHIRHIIHPYTKDIMCSYIKIDGVEYMVAKPVETNAPVDGHTTGYFIGETISDNGRTFVCTQPSVCPHRDPAGSVWKRL